MNCERINLFVGKPNVGKSNLLEALALLGVNYQRANRTAFSDLIRYEQMADLFYDQNILEEEIKVESPEIGAATLKYHKSEFAFFLNDTFQNAFNVNFGTDGRPNNGNGSSEPGSSVKYYQFPDKQVFRINNEEPALQFPHGENFLSILQTNKKVRLEASAIFEQYGLELLLDAHSNRLDIVKRREGILFKTPFSLVADTLRRYLFHLAAIESNRDTILLFEEPESHNFPPYITRLARRIMEQESNQFFITTHSPFLFNTLVEEEQNVAIFLVEFEDFQTKVRRLSEEQLREVLDYGLNIFTQQELFT